MLRSLTAKQFNEWFYYSFIEPFGEICEDYRTAAIRETFFNVMVAKEHRRPLKDFLLEWKVSEEATEVKKAQPQSWQDKLAIAKIIAMAYNKKVKAVDA